MNNVVVPIKYIANDSLLVCALESGGHENDKKCCDEELKIITAHVNICILPVPQDPSWPCPIRG